MHIFGCLSMLLLLGVVVTFSLAKGFFRLFFGGPKDTFSNGQRHTSREEKDTFRSPSNPSPSPKKKIIDDDEGEYVDFEEIDK